MLDARAIRHWLAAYLIGLGCACAPVVPPEPVYVAPEPTMPRIVVLKSAANAVYEEAASAFIEQMRGTATVYSLEFGPRPRTMRAQLMAIKPDGFFVLGTKATLFVAKRFPTTATVFAMVLNYQRHGLQDHDNLMGISLETPTTREFMQFKMVLPQLKKVAAFYSPKETRPFVERAGIDLQKLGLELHSVPIRRTSDLESAYGRLPDDADAIWLLNDTVVMNAASFAFLNTHTQKDKIPFICSLHEAFAREGALMSVSVDFAALGGQASGMLRMHLEQGRSIAAIGIQPPISAQLAVNLDTAKAIGIEVPMEVLPFINQVIVSSEKGEALTP